MAKVTSLGYLGIGVSDLAVWKTYANDVLGIEAIEAGRDSIFGTTSRYGGCRLRRAVKMI